MNIEKEHRKKRWHSPSRPPQESPVDKPPANRKSTLKRLESEIERLQMDLRFRDIFVAALVHDIRNLAYASKMSLTLIGEELPRRAGDVAELFAIAERNLEHIEAMLQDLLDLKRMVEINKSNLQFEECSFESILKDAFDVLLPPDRRRLRVEGSEGVRGVWNRGAMRRVLVNLVNNALKYGDSRTLVSIFVKQEGQVTTVSVHNFGPPISLEDQKILFVPFFRADNASQLSKGWGLGLPAVHSLVEAHGGSLAVCSSLDRGTTFTVTLPNSAVSNQG